MFQARLVQEPLNLQVVEVGDAQGFHQPLVHQFLHGLLQEGMQFSWRRDDTGMLAQLSNDTEY